MSCRSLTALAMAGVMMAMAGADVAAAQQKPLPKKAESRATLVKACRADGTSAEECSCIGNIIAANFNDREMAGAAIAFADSNDPDPVAGLKALEDAGFSQQEVLHVVERVETLSDQAKAKCEKVAPKGDATSD
jgi:hypothetical protein